MNFSSIEISAVTMAPSKELLPPFFGPEHIAFVMCSSGLLTVAQVIARISNGEEFHVSDATGDVAVVRVVWAGAGRLPYITTSPDSVMRDNLLSLPGGPYYRQAVLSGRPPAARTLPLRAC